MRTCRRTTCGLSIFLGFCSFASAAEPTTTPATQPDPLFPAGLSEVVRLWPGDPPCTSPVDPDDIIIPGHNPTRRSYAVRTGHLPSLSVFLPPHASSPTAAVILCPGGGYSFENATFEGHEVAEALAAKGIAGFVLRYRLGAKVTPKPDELPPPQQDVFRAIELIRGQADHWNVNPKQIGVMGFSAGGHLAASAATMYDQADEIRAKAGNDAISKVSARPDFAVILYGVDTMQLPLAHANSRFQLIGRHPDDETAQRFSPELHITSDTPPLYIIHGEQDKVCPVATARTLADAAEKAGVPHDLIIIPKAGHGFALGSSPSMWFDACLKWLAEHNAISTH